MSDSNKGGGSSGFASTYKKSKSKRGDKLKQKLEDEVKLRTLSGMAADVLLGPGTLRDLLQGCAKAVVQILDVAFVRIWTVDESENFLILQASAGIYTHIDGKHSVIEVGELKVGLIASERKPHLTNNVQADTRVSDKDWAKAEGIVSFAGYPIVAGDRLLGVMAMFARHPLTDSTLNAMSVIANHIALGIENKTNEQELCSLAEFVRVSSEAVVSWRLLDGKISYANAAANKLYSYGQGELVGKTISQLYPDDRKNELASIISRISKGETVETFDTVRKTKNGSLLEVSLLVAPLRDSQGNVIAAASLSREVCERTFLKYAERKVSLMQEREDFMFTLTHDLKSPLIGANRVLQLLANGEYGDIPADAFVLIQKLYESNSSLIDLIQIIIDVYRHEKGAGNLQLVELDICDFLTQCSLVWKAEARTKNIELKIKTVAPSLYVMIDPDSMRRVLRNLVDNAIKFSVEGGMVEVALESSAELAIVNVNNKGEIIGHEDIQFLFQRFWQGARGRKFVAGSGLGLYLCHKIVSAHNGCISCTSDDSSGTTFSISLPLSRID